jgi:hypothetical protein
MMKAAAAAAAAADEEEEGGGAKKADIIARDVRLRLRPAARTAST